MITHVLIMFSVSIYFQKDVYKSCILSHIIICKVAWQNIIFGGQPFTPTFTQHSPYTLLSNTLSLAWTDCVRYSIPVKVFNIWVLLMYIFNLVIRILTRRKLSELNNVFFVGPTSWWTSFSIIDWLQGDWFCSIYLSLLIYDNTWNTDKHVEHRHIRGTQRHVEHIHTRGTQTHTWNTDTHVEQRQARVTLTHTWNTDTHVEHRHTWNTDKHLEHRHTRGTETSTWNTDKHVEHRHTRGTETSTCNTDTHVIHRQTRGTQTSTWNTDKHVKHRHTQGTQTNKWNTFNHMPFEYWKISSYNK